MKRYRVFFTNGNDLILEADTAGYVYNDNVKKTFLVYSIDEKVIATFNVDNIVGDMVIEEYSVKGITGKGI